MKRLILSFLLIVTSTATADVKKVKIGIASNFSEISSNSFNPYGDYFRNGIQLALRDSKKVLEKSGIQIELQEFDYGTSSSRVLEAAKRAVSSSVIGVIGYNYSTDALLAAPIHQKGNLPMLTPSATADRIGELGKYVHMGSFRNRSMGNALAKFAYSQLKVKKTVIIPAANCAYCLDLAQAYEEEFRNSGGKISKQISVLSSDTEFSQVIQQIKQTSFDSVLIPNHELVSSRIIAALLNARIETIFLGGDGWGNEGKEFYAVIGNRDLRGYSISHWHPALNTPETKKFVREYLKEFNKIPNDTSVLSYDAMKLMIHALLISKNLTREGLESALNSINEIKGVTGLAKYSHKTYPSKPLLFLETKLNTFRIFRVIDSKVNW